MDVGSDPVSLGDSEKGMTSSSSTQALKMVPLQPSNGLKQQPSNGLKQQPGRSQAALFLRRKRALDLNGPQLMELDHYTAYRQVFTIIFVVNLAVLVALVSTSSPALITAYAGDAAAANLAVGVLFRQEQVINTLFQVLTSIPHSWPLYVRAKAAKVFHYGGAHSGCGVAAAVWLLLYTALTTRAYILHPSPSNTEALTTAWLLVTLLLLLVVAAYPAIRVRFHNQFEMFHRFAGWAALGVFWAHVLFSAHGAAVQSSTQMGKVLVQSVTFWCILVATLPIVVSWSQLRRRKVTAERLSDHATRLHFEYATIDECLGVRVSASPLLEWHSFATITETEYDFEEQTTASAEAKRTAALTLTALADPPTTSTFDSESLSSAPSQPRSPSSSRNNRRGFSILISNAGDWTQRVINSPPAYLWTRGSLTRGVIYSARLFHRVVIVTTGSGIGPCLSLLVAHTSLLPSPPRVIWSAPDPEQTFGTHIIESVKRADPAAVIWNTKTKGRPNLRLLAAQLVEESGAEAVFIISNPKVCKSVVTGLEDMGIKAYAPIFDS